MDSARKSCGSYKKFRIKAMNELIKVKQNILSQLQGLCAHCACGNKKTHSCPVQDICVRIKSINGVPLIVNSQFKGVFGNKKTPVA